MFLKLSRGWINLDAIAGAKLLDKSVNHDPKMIVQLIAGEPWEIIDRADIDRLAAVLDAKAEQS